MLESAEIPGGRVVAGMACEDGHGGDHNDQGDIYIMYVCLYVTKMSTLCQSETFCICLCVCHVPSLPHM